MRSNPRSPAETITPMPAPPLPKRSKVARHPVVVFLNLVFSVIVITIVGGVALAYWGTHRVSEPGTLAEDKAIMIAPGMNVDAITNLLEREAIIDTDGAFPDRWFFKAQVGLRDAGVRLKAGEYLIPARASIDDVIDLFVDGTSILHGVTIPEGRTSLQVVEILQKNDKLVGEINSVPPEGSLLPETYKFTRGAQRQEIIERMMAAHDREVDIIWSRRVDDLPITTKEEFVTLASIVEKETGKADERPRVAAVFINRLNRGMRLQSDPTIVYGIVGGKGTLGRGIRRSEITKKTPYNTYVINGLPPGPIANPGRAALEAVANPSRTEELYFVADGTGGHAFATTLNEHNKNVAKWRKIEQKRREEAASRSQND